MPGEIRSIGWDAIINEFEKLYPDQLEPRHYGTLISWRLGGKDPLEGISVYETEDYWHFITFGLTELFEKESENKDISGYGMEFTLKLKKDDITKEEVELKGVCGILQTIARITFTKGEIFRPFEYLYTGQKEGMDVKQKSKITGFITVPETKIQGIDTPNGHVDFVELVGVTDSELQAIMHKETTVKELYEKLANRKKETVFERFKKNFK